MIIQHIKNKDIDRKKWDKTVANAVCGFIYFQSFYLDGLCIWDALVYGDYECIMPLPYKKKYGISYIYTPYFISQLGIVGDAAVIKLQLNNFVNAIPSQFKWVHINLNEQNFELDLYSTYSIKIRTNYVLSLQKSYEELYNHFNKDARKNIKNAQSNWLTIAENIDIEIVFDFYKNAYGGLVKNISKKAFDNFKNVCKKALLFKKGFTVAVLDSQNKICVAAFFAIDNKRLYYLLGAPNDDGRKNSATHFLINEIIKKYAASDLSLDFEGSDIESVASFYKKFSPEKRNYLELKINRLPKIFSWLKK